MSSSESKTMICIVAFVTAPFFGVMAVYAFTAFLNLLMSAIEHAAYSWREFKIGFDEERN